MAERWSSRDRHLPPHLRAWAQCLWLTCWLADVYQLQQVFPWPLPELGQVAAHAHIHTHMYTHTQTHTRLMLSFGKTTKILLLCDLLRWRGFHAWLYISKLLVEPLQMDCPWVLQFWFAWLQCTPSSLPFRLSAKQEPHNSRKLPVSLASVNLGTAGYFGHSYNH